MTGWRDRPLPEVLAAHRLDGLDERPLATDGWSGAAFSVIDGKDHRVILKRASAANDWIVRATNDHDIREATLIDALDDALGWIGQSASVVWSAYLGVARDPDGSAVVLMRDVSAALGGWARAPGSDAFTHEATDRLLEGMARLHLTAWSEVVGSRDQRLGLPDPWCPLEERLTLLTRRSATGYDADGNPVGAIFLRGWDGFDAHASPAARDLVDRLGADAGPLIEALGRLPGVGLHGDVKIANAGWADANGGVLFIDWQMTLVAPVAVELGWAMVTNSAELPIPPDALLDRYHAAVMVADGFGAELDIPSRDPEAVLGDWDAQRDLAMIIGLLLRGWRKGADTVTGATLGSGVAAADDLAWWCERAVGAAERRL